MSPVSVTWRRTIGHARGLFTSALAIGLFLALVAATFAVNFARAEGGTQPLAAIWAGAVAPVLPVLAALLAMGVWSDERQSGRMAEMLSVAVREREYVLGKFLGVWTILMASVLVSLAATVGSLFFFAPNVLATTALLSFAPALFVLGVQGMLWVAVSEAASAVFRHAAAAAAT